MVAIPKFVSSQTGGTINQNMGLATGLTHTFNVFSILFQVVWMLEIFDWYTWIECRVVQSYTTLNKPTTTSLWPIKIFKGLKSKKQVHLFDHQTIQQKKQGFILPTQKNTLVSPENPSKVTIHLHQVWSLPKKVFHLMTQKVPFKNSPNGPRVQIVFHVWHIPTSHDLFFDLHIGQGSFLPFFAQETDGLPGRCKKGQKKRIYKIETYGCFLKWWYPQIIHFYGDFHHKPSILGYPYFWKHPYKK